MRVQKRFEKYYLLWLVICISVVGNIGLHAQNVTGEYYGVGNVSKDGNYSQYLSELILKQTGNKITGEYNYYFKTDYLSQKITGYYDAKQRLVVLQIVPLLHYGATNKFGADCLMKGFFVLKTSRIETTLQGQFEANSQYRYTCPNIFLKLTKELLTPQQRKALVKAKEQQYLAVEAAESEAAKKSNGNIADSGNTAASLNNLSVTVNKKNKLANKAGQEHPVASTQIQSMVKREVKDTATLPTTKSKAQNEVVSDNNNLPGAIAQKATMPTQQVSAATIKVAVTKTIAEENKTTTNAFTAILTDAPSKNETSIAEKSVSLNKKGVTETIIATPMRLDTIKKAPPANIAPKLQLPLGETSEEMTRKLALRTFEESQVILVDTDSLQIILYDNGEVDGDTIALFDNRQLIARNQLLTDQPIKLTLAIDTLVHEISMYAQNLGRIPPNTALCIFMAGNQRYELILTSSLERNGTLKFRKRTLLEIEEENKYFK